MPSYVDKVLRGSFFLTGSETEVDITLPESVVMDRSYCSLHCKTDIAGGGSVRTLAIRHELINATTIRVARAHASGLIDGHWEVTQFADGVATVQRGAFEHDTNPSVIDLTTSPYSPVAPGRAFVVHGMTNTQNGGTTNSYVRTRFASGGDEIEFQGGSGFFAGTTNITWELIEFSEASGITVDHYEEGVGIANGGVLDVPLNSPVDLEKTFLIQTGAARSSATGPSRVSGEVRFLDDETLRFHRYVPSSATGTHTYTVAVVHLPEGKVVPFRITKALNSKQFDGASWAALDPDTTSYPVSGHTLQNTVAVDGATGNLLASELFALVIPEATADGVEATVEEEGLELFNTGYAVQWSWEEEGEGEEVDAVAGHLLVGQHNAGVIMQQAVSAQQTKLLISQFNAQVEQRVTIDAAAASLLIDARTADVLMGFKISPYIRSLLLNAQPSEIFASTLISVSAASLALRTLAATIAEGRNIDAELARLAITGHPTDLTLHVDVEAQEASLELSGRNASVILGVDIRAERAAMQLAAHMVEVVASDEVAVARGGLIITRYDADVGVGEQVEVQRRALQISPRAASVIYGDATLVSLGRLLIRSVNVEVRVGSLIISVVPILVPSVEFVYDVPARKEAHDVGARKDSFVVPARDDSITIH